MDGKHPNRTDPRPKRRKKKDNPYTIFTEGIGTPYFRYYLSFRDGEGERRCREIDKALFDAFNAFELDDLTYMNEADRHYAHSKLSSADAMVNGLKGALGAII